jgi:predicted transcriptional regulator
MNRINLNIPSNLYRRLKQAAKVEDRTLTVILCRALLQYLEANHPELEVAVTQEKG